VCVKSIITKNYTEMHGQRNKKPQDFTLGIQNYVCIGRLIRFNESIKTAKLFRYYTELR